MTYYCMDCSYRGGKCGPSGECPACGSFNLSRGGGVRERQPRPGKRRLILLAFLWVWFLALVVWKMSGGG